MTKIAQNRQKRLIIIVFLQAKTKMREKGKREKKTREWISQRKAR